MTPATTQEQPTAAEIEREALKSIIRKNCGYDGRADGLWSIYSSDAIIAADALGIPLTGGTHFDIEHLKAATPPVQAPAAGVGEKLIADYEMDIIAQPFELAAAIDQAITVVREEEAKIWRAAMRESLAAARADEREQCAKVAEAQRWAVGPVSAQVLGQTIAATIRARQP